MTARPGARPRARAAGEAGVTMVELMVSLLLSALATALAFSLYVTASRAQRTQGRVSEAQQTVRAASELLTRDIRQAGLGAKTVRTAMTGDPTTAILPLSILNDAYGEGPDQITVMYADFSAQTAVLNNAAAFNSTETNVVDATPFGIGDVIVAVRNDPTTVANFGAACVLQVTGVTGGPGTYMLQHNPGGSGWNQGTNAQCSVLGSWGDGYTMVYRFTSRAYRIKPTIAGTPDPRGILQMSPSGGFVVNDWTDIAVGVIDMQFTMQVYEPGDTVDLDGVAEPAGYDPAEYDWYSGDNMETVLTAVPNAEPIRIRVSLLAKAGAPQGSPQLDATPDFLGAPPANNELGDHAGTTLPVSDPTSPYFGDNVYRWTSTVIDVRNLGLGR